MNKPNMQVIEDRVYGTWLWQGPSGAYLADDEGNFLSIEAAKYDLAAVAQLRAEATAMGFGDGKPVWHSGMRKLTDAEYDLMMERLEAGLEPDPAEEYMQMVEAANKDKKNK